MGNIFLEDTNTNGETSLMNLSKYIKIELTFKSIV